MVYLVFLHYFLANLLYFNVLPNIIIFEDYKYYHYVYYDSYKGTNKWVCAYSRLIKRETDTLELLEVTSSTRYGVYMKTVFALWKMRKVITISIDNY